MIPALQITSSFPACPHVILADASYAVPTLRWLQGPFWSFFRQQRWGFRLGAWTRSNDCDNFARAYAQAAQDCHALSPGSVDEGLAVGEIFYHSPQGPHAIVAAFVGEPASLVFIEPQDNRVLDLSPLEQRSIFFARF